jgi:Protein of unknown function (DUF2851)
VVALLREPGQTYVAAPALVWLAEAVPLSEAELATIWEGQRQPPGSLTTSDGVPVRALHPGRRNEGPGPDFRDAVLLIGGERRQGDVELHLRAGAFYQHGHHRDPAYANLVLHVVYESDGAEATGWRPAPRYQ